MRGAARIAAGFVLLGAPVCASPAGAAEAPVPQTIPALQRGTPAGGTWALRKHPRIVVRRADRKRLLGEARQLAADLGALTGRHVAVTARRRARARRGDVLISLRHDGELGGEGYELRVGSRFEIAAPTSAGVFYGGRTLLQLVRGGRPVVRGRARDWPRYPERGLMIDLGRRLYPQDWIEAHIREMAYLKLNLLHLHLTDDQRWGIQSETHPEIVSPGALSKQQMREILAFAHRHHVTVVPEIDMPGHMGSVLAKHPDLELRAATAVSPPQTPDTRKLDIVNPDALAMVKQILDEYLPLFPGPYWHVGGDEYVSPAMYGLYPQLQTDAIARYGAFARTKDEMLGFFNWVDSIVRAHGKTLRAWQDELGPGSVLHANSDIVAEWWISFSPLSEPRPPTPQQLLASGHRIVNAGWFPTYYTGDIGPIQGKPSVANAYESWAPNQFCTATAADMILEPCAVVAPDEQGNLGSKINAWDNHELTLAQIAAGLFPRLRMLAQKTWGSRPLTPSYTEFERIMAVLGHAPGYVDVK
jgi:hexosaminidase